MPDPSTPDPPTFDPGPGPPRPWTTLASETLLSRWWLTLRADRVRLPGGHVIDEYHVVEAPDWACALALTDDGHAVLVEQYRHGIGRTLLELPAGALDAGEGPEAAARRELREETGYAADRWDALGRLAAEPGRQTSYGHVFVAHGCRPVAAPDRDAAEDQRVRLVPAGDLVGLVEAGRIAHATHAAAVFWARARGWLDEPGAAARVQGRPTP